MLIIIYCTWEFRLTNSIINYTNNVPTTQYNENINAAYHQELEARNWVRNMTHIYVIIKHTYKNNYKIKLFISNYCQQFKNFNFVEFCFDWNAFHYTVLIFFILTKKITWFWSDRSQLIRQEFLLAKVYYIIII